MKLAIDLFSGSGSFGKVARRLGYEVISIDNRRRVNTCEPSLKIDILNLPVSFFNSMSPSVIWVGFPCTTFSNASGGHHLSKDFTPLTKLAENHHKLLLHTLSILKELPDSLYFIENPRGKLQQHQLIKSFISETNGTIKYCTLSSYNFPTTKPTGIITNFKQLKLRPMDKYGRGAKNKSNINFKNMTKVQRSTTPKLLIKEILQQIS